MEFFGADDADMAAPGKDPGLDFFQVVQVKDQLGAAVGELLELLAEMPLTFADELGSPAVKMKDDLVAAFASKDAEAAGKVFVDVEIAVADEAIGQKPGGADASEVEGAEAADAGIVADGIPLALDAGEVVGLDAALLGVLSVEFKVIDFDLLLLLHRGGHGLEDFEVDRAGFKLAEGDGGFSSWSGMGKRPSREAASFSKAVRRGASKGVPR